MSAVISKQETQIGQKPSELLIRLVTGYKISIAISIAAQLGIADLLHESPKTADELAHLTDTHSQSLFRFLRVLSSVGVFRRDGENRFHLTPLSECLRSDIPESLRSISIWSGIEEVWKVYGEMLYSLKTGKTTFEKIYGMESFPYFAQNRGVAEIFDKAMSSFTSSIVPAVVASYDFSNVNTVADVAGGHGILLARILKSNPHLKGILFDQPYVAEGANALLEEEAIAERCQIVGGDFFKSVPGGAEIYLLKHIIHDWDEERALAILRNVHKAMPENGKLLLIECVLSETDEPSLGPIVDLEMLVMAGGRERTAKEYKELLAVAGFRLNQVIQTPSSMSIVEAVKA